MYEYILLLLLLLLVLLLLLLLLRSASPTQRVTCHLPHVTFDMWHGISNPDAANDDDELQEVGRLHPAAAPKEVRCTSFGGERPRRVAAKIAPPAASAASCSISSGMF